MAGLADFVPLVTWKSSLPVGVVVRHASSKTMWSRCVAAS